MNEGSVRYYRTNN